MLPPENADPLLDASTAEGTLAEAGTYASEKEAFQHGLVVLAAGSPYWLIPYEGRFRLLVQPASLEAARRQLALYDRESRRWPLLPFGRGEPDAPTSVIPSLLWTLATIAVFQAQETWPGELENAGMLDAERVFAHHEFWRIGTALFLHADLAHLTANLVSGFFIFSAVLTGLGRVRGGLLLVLASLAGNAGVVSINASNTYRSLGASTAVFAGLGLLTGTALRRALRRDGVARWSSLFSPLAAGLALLGLFGAGELHTDVAAHASGFTAGLFCGLFAGLKRAVSSA